MWAGYIALANEQAAAKKVKPVGFINPRIYPLGLGKTYDTLFHDITTRQQWLSGDQRLRFGVGLG